MAEPSKTHAPSGLRRNLERGTAPGARPRPGRGAVWPSLRCRQRRHTSVWVFVAAARRYAPTSPAPPRLAYGPPALATRPFVLSPRTATIVLFMGPSLVQYFHQVFNGILRTHERQLRNDLFLHGGVRFLLGEVDQGAGVGLNEQRLDDLAADRRVLVAFVERRERLT